MRALFSFAQFKFRSTGNYFMAVFNIVTDDVLQV